MWKVSTKQVTKTNLDLHNYGLTSLILIIEQNLPSIEYSSRNASSPAVIETMQNKTSYNSNNL